MWSYPFFRQLMVRLTGSRIYRISGACLLAIYNLPSVCLDEPYRILIFRHLVTPLKPYLHFIQFIETCVITNGTTQDTSGQCSRERFVRPSVGDIPVRVVQSLIGGKPYGGHLFDARRSKNKANPVLVFSVMICFYEGFSEEKIVFFICIEVTTGYSPTDGNAVRYQEIHELPSRCLDCSKRQGSVVR